MQDRREPAPNAARTYAGVDVSKGRLDVHLHSIGGKLRLSNDAAGLRQLARALRGLGPARVVMEATGKFHRLAHRSLHGAGFAVSVVNPARARHYANAIGVLAKTDPVDARVLALYGATLDPRADAPAPANLAALQELAHARQAAMAERTALINRRGAAETAFLRAELARRVAAAETHVARLDAEAARIVAADKGLARRREVLMSIPGVGPVTALAMLADLAEMGACANKKIALLAGLAPVNRDSGGKVGQARIAGGRAHVRKAVFMAALTAVRGKAGGFKAVYLRLTEKGKPHKVALVAVMRKIVELANTLITENRLWTPIRP